MYSNGAMFQQEKTLLMVLLEVWTQPEYILRIHFFGRMGTIALELRVLKWRYLQMTLNWEEKPNFMLYLYMKTSFEV